MRVTVPISILVVALCLLLSSGASRSDAGQRTIASPGKETGGRSGSLSPADALKRFVVPEDLEIEQVLAEPTVRQPVSMKFDERGRLWVVQYVQYPYPAGLKMLSRDKYWRAVYDKVPPPPPNHFRGKDKITIHEDSDGDGAYDKHKTFLDGLNIVTACVKGRGGVWVLNPPYLLFYADKDNDDVPDGDPQVHLSGFGLEDTHSVVNSLRWGPDGWLYAAQGSTVSGNVKRLGLDEKGVRSMGQHIWRYHPETRRYEIFAEGGGNAFGVEIDSKGRIYSGHNGGDTRGFHYVQGGYFRKGFSKHGPLSNPYAFGYFPAMRHHDVRRFTHTFVIYEGHALPDRYHGKLFGVAPLLSHVVCSDIGPEGSSFMTKDLGHPVTTSDRRFRPVDVKVGPDEALYVADFYEHEISHRQHFEGQIDPSNGRIYRLKPKGAEPGKPFDLGQKTTRELIDWLDHPNKWFRQTALRLIGDRKDRSVIPVLRRMLQARSGQLALEALWALNLIGGLSDTVATKTLSHDDPYVRLWTVRLLCDAKEVSPSIANRLAEMSRQEPHLEVRSQLACSARRLPGSDALPIVRNLLARDEDVGDIRIPLLLWWAIESKVESDRELVLAMFGNPELWRLPMLQEHILGRLMRRYAMAGSRRDMLDCARLFELSPNGECTELLMRGFEQAFKGRSLASLPDELVEALEREGGGSVVLGVRQGRADAVEKALEVIADEKANTELRIEYTEIFGEVNQPGCLPVLLKVIAQSGDEQLRMAALTALQQYKDASIGSEVIRMYDGLSDDARSVAQTLLVSRKTWTWQLLQAVDAGKLQPGSVPLEAVRKMTIHRDDRIAGLVRRHWENVQGAPTAEMQERIARLSGVIRSGSGDPYNGKKLYGQTCAKCHILFGEGGRIGPDLTTYQRDDRFSLLLNVVNPSIEIREDFENFLVVTDDGRTVSGFLVDRDNRVLVLRGVDGQNITLARDRIEEMLQQPTSLMPEGLLRDLSAQQVRDLFAYLRSSQPLND